MQLLWQLFTAFRYILCWQTDKERFDLKTYKNFLLVKVYLLIFSVQPYQPGMPAGPGGPMGPGWMAMPHAPPPNCPPGLEYLSQIDQLLVKQKTEILEGTMAIHNAMW